MMRKLALSLALALPAAPALAQTPPAPPPAAAPVDAPIDSGRLAAAEITVAHVFPDGTYARIMDKSMDMVMSSMMDSVGKMSLRDVAAMGGMSEEQLAKVGPGTLNELMAIYDPVYEQRMQLTMRVMMGEMGTMMTRFEPAIRDGLAQAYARRFTAVQLAEMNAFFATPTGKAYAAEAMVIFMDPAVMAKMQEFLPVLTRQMPAIMGKVQAATAALPKPRKPDELSDGERKRIAELLGTPAGDAGDGRGFGLAPVP